MRCWLFNGVTLLSLVLGIAVAERCMRGAWWRTVVASAGPFTVAARQGSDTPDVFMWLMVLLVQSIPYSATVIMAIISGFSRVPAQLIRKITASPDVASDAGFPAEAADQNPTAS
jgi:hypothetical protein